MNLSTIIEMKKEEFEEMNRKCDGAYGIGKFPPEVKSFLEKAIRESVEEALQEVRIEKFRDDINVVSNERRMYHFAWNECSSDFDSRVKEFMK